MAGARREARAVRKPYPRMRPSSAHEVARWGRTLSKRSCATAVEVRRSVSVPARPRARCREGQAGRRGGGVSQAARAMTTPVVPMIHTGPWLGLWGLYEVG